MFSLSRFRVILLVTRVIFAIVYVLPLQAQIPTASPRIGIDISDGIRFFEMGSTGNVTLVYDLPSEFVVYPESEANWVVLTSQAIQLSPTGRRVGFVALRAVPGRIFEEAAFFWFDLTEPTLHHVMLPGVFDVQWSSDENQILLTPPNAVGEFSSVSQSLVNLNAFILSITTETLTQIPVPAGEQHRGHQWLDTQRLIYQTSTDDCTAACPSTLDLFLFDLTTQTRTRFTHIGTQLKSDLEAEVLQFYSYCIPEPSLWSSISSRLYYVVDCEDTSGNSQSFLYSTDLAGNGRKELNPLNLTPDSYYSAVRDVTLVEEVVYVTIEAEIRPLPGGPETIFTQWYVVAINTQGTRVLSDVHFPGSASSILNVVEFSPDNARVLLGGTDPRSQQLAYVIVFELVTGTIVSEARNDGQLCDAHWMDIDVVLYTTFEFQCNTLTNRPLENWLFNVTTNMQNEVLMDEVNPLLFIASTKPLIEEVINAPTVAFTPTAPSTSNIY